jgi:hypothetical protein
VERPLDTRLRVFHPAPLLRFLWYGGRRIGRSAGVTFASGEVVDLPRPHHPRSS